MRPNAWGRGQNLEVKAKAEAKFKEAEQNVVFHGENICCKNTAQSLMPSVV